MVLTLETYIVIGTIIRIPIGDKVYREEFRGIGRRKYSILIYLLNGMSEVG